jgi:hypothetical protein
MNNDTTPNGRATEGQTTKAEDRATVIHLGVWVILCAGLWLQWKPAMLIGFLLAVGNITGLFLPLIANALVFVILLPFQPKTTFGVNIRLMLAMGLVVQVWQFLFWIEGVAAH